MEQLGQILFKIFSFNIISIKKYFYYFFSYIHNHVQFACNWMMLMQNERSTNNYLKLLSSLIRRSQAEKLLHYLSNITYLKTIRIISWPSYPLPLHPSKKDHQKRLERCHGRPTYPGSGPSPAPPCASLLVSSVSWSSLTDPKTNQEKNQEFPPQKHVEDLNVINASDANRWRE